MKLVQETIIKKYRDLDTLVETIKQYHYSSMDEKLKHKIKMEQSGFTDSGQVQDNLGSVSNPRYVIFGSYYKYEIKKK